MKETATQYSGPFANFIVQHLQVSSEDLVSITRQTRHSLIPTTHSQKMGSPLSLTLQLMKNKSKHDHRMFS